MALNFPSSGLNVGRIYEKWVWNGSAWDFLGGYVSSSSATTTTTTATPTTTTTTATPTTTTTTATPTTTTTTIASSPPTISASGIFALIFDATASTISMKLPATSITGSPTEKGFVASGSNINPTIGNTKIVSGSGNADFVTTLTNSNFSMVENTQYYVRAFATNSAGTTYSSPTLTFFTRKPTLDSLYLNKGAVKYTATIQDLGSVIGNGITDKGLVWATVPIDIYLQSLTEISDGTTTFGQWGGTVTTPSSGTTYYARAYVDVSGFGRVYSNQRTYVA
jgi:hypothetical protein